MRDSWYFCVYYVFAWLYDYTALCLNHRIHSNELWVDYRTSGVNETNVLGRRRFNAEMAILIDLIFCSCTSLYRNEIILNVIETVFYFRKNFIFEKTLLIY